MVDLVSSVVVGITTILLIIPGIRTIARVLLLAACRLVLLLVLLLVNVPLLLLLLVNVPVNLVLRKVLLPPEVQVQLTLVIVINSIIVINKTTG